MVQAAKAAAELREVRMEKVSEAFNRFDKDGSGSISREELAEARTGGCLNKCLLPSQPRARIASCANVSLLDPSKRL